MITAFTARFCFADALGNSFIAGLADDEHETTRYALFERLKAPPEQDLKVGFDLPHFEIDDQGYSGYGLVERVHLALGQLSIWLTEEGRRVLGVQAGSIDVLLSPGLDLNQFVLVMVSIFGEGRFVRVD